MRGVIGLLVCLGLGCDALAERPSSQDESTPDQETAASAGSAGTAGSTAGSWPTLTLGGAPSVEPEPEPEPDWCETAEHYGATYCEVDRTTLEYCEPAPTDGQECIAYERPPKWVFDLLLQCTAHCGVGIATSQRMLEGSCCYVANSEYYGR